MSSDTNKARAARTATANEFANEIYAEIIEPAIEGGCSFRLIATFLNNYEKPTPSGRGDWSATQVSRIIKRVKRDS